MNSTLYTLRHKATQHLMPELESGRGYSHWTPTEADPSGGISASLSVPRLFVSEKAADRARVAWAAGVHEHHYLSDSVDGPGEYAGTVARDVGRKKDDLEVIPVLLTPSDKAVVHIKFSQQACVDMMRKAFEDTLAEWRQREDPTVTHYVPFREEDGDFDWDCLHPAGPNWENYELPNPAWKWVGICLPLKKA